jgi:hypothetical protein
MKSIKDMPFRTVNIKGGKAAPAGGCVARRSLGQRADQ